MPVTCTRGWSERLAIPITPRRTPEGRSKKTKEERRDLYRVPHDRLVTDTFAEWQDGGANPALPDSALGQRFGGAETQGHVGQGAPIPPPAHILARRQQYALLPLTDGDASLQGELTETIQEILVEADMVRTGDYGSPRFENSPRSARMGGASVFSAVGALEAKQVMQELKSAREAERAEAAAKEREDALRRAEEANAPKAVEPPKKKKGSGKKSTSPKKQPRASSPTKAAVAAGQMNGAGPYMNGSATTSVASSSIPARSRTPSPKSQRSRTPSPERPLVSVPSDARAWARCSRAYG